MGLVTSYIRECLDLNYKSESIDKVNDYYFDKIIYDKIRNTVSNFVIIKKYLTYLIINYPTVKILFYQIVISSNEIKKNIYIVILQNIYYDVPCIKHKVILLNDIQNFSFKNKYDYTRVKLNTNDLNLIIKYSK